MLSATNAECHIKALSAECNYAECHIKALPAECNYAECLYAEHRGPFITAYLKVEILEKSMVPPLRDRCSILNSAANLVPPLTTFKT
jgi:hypothetical protein